ncbi:MAG: hypothetical protein NUV73_01375, partial [Candidatus Daviesbacteria bacterium]|nr:hypothetical protein [Candidatus Daviesbacteria bacterium]
PAKPFWRQAYNAQLGTYLVYSEKALRDKIKQKTSDLSASYTSAESLEGITKEIKRAYAALANVRHVPQDHIIQAKTNDEYAYWSRLFPTVEEYVMNLAEQEVPVTENIRQSLEAIVSTSSGVLARTQDALRRTGASQQVYENIVTGKTPRESDEKAFVEAENAVTEQFSYWVPESLQQHPGRVFVAPANAGYLGLATRDRIGFNELLLVGNDLRKIAGTARHELIHKIYGLRDYTPEFIMMLLESAKANLPQVV